MVTRYEVEIETLVLPDLPPAHRTRVAAAFSAELSRLLQRDGLPSAPGGAVPALPVTRTPGALGVALARQVHQQLAGPGDSHLTPGPLS